MIAKGKLRRRERNYQKSIPRKPTQQSNRSETNAQKLLKVSRCLRLFLHVCKLYHLRSDHIERFVIDEGPQTRLQHLATMRLVHLHVRTAIGFPQWIVIGDIAMEALRTQMPGPIDVDFRLRVHYARPDHLKRR